MHPGVCDSSSNLNRYRHRSPPNDCPVKWVSFVREFLGSSLSLCLFVTFLYPNGAYRHVSDLLNSVPMRPVVGDCCARYASYSTWTQLVIYNCFRPWRPLQCLWFGNRTWVTWIIRVAFVLRHSLPGLLKGMWDQRQPVWGIQYVDLLLRCCHWLNVATFIASHSQLYASTSAAEYWSPFCIVTSLCCLTWQPLGAGQMLTMVCLFWPFHDLGWANAHPGALI